jgi:hypothetical protein
MIRRSPLRAKRKHKPVELGRYHDWVAQQPCLACGGQATVHHVTGYADRPGRFSRDHWLVVPLCPAHHQIQHGPRQSVEALGHQGFYDEWGIDLYADALLLAEAWKRKAAA